MYKKITTLIVVMISLPIISCKNYYQVKEKQDFDSSLVISQPVLLKNAYTEEGSQIYDAMLDSRYFNEIYREDDEYTKKPELTFDAKIERENISNPIQKLSAFTSIVTVGLAPANVSFKYIVNIAVFKNGKFLNRYKPSIDSSNTIIGWNIITADKRSIVKAVLPELLKNLKTDLAKK